MEYRLYPLKDQERLDEICTLFAKGLADTTPAYWKWKHFSENGQPEGMILVAEAEDGTFAGMFALQPERYIRGDEQITVIQNEDLVIDPAHRGTGLMKRLYRYAFEYYKEQGMVGSISFCNSASYPIFLKYGAEDRGDIYSYNTKKRLLPVYLNRRNWKKGEWEICLGDQMPADLFYPVSEESYALRKSDAFMKWKFVDNPDGPFQWLTIRENGKMMGYMLVKIVQGKFRRAVNIYDWALQEDMPDAVLKAAVQLLQTHANWVSLWGRYSERVCTQWMRAGLIQKNEQGTHFVLDTYGEKSMPQNWHLTRADLDY